MSDRKLSQTLLQGPGLLILIIGTGFIVGLSSDVVSDYWERLTSYSDKSNPGKLSIDSTNTLQPSESGTNTAAIDIGTINQNALPETAYGSGVPSGFKSNPLPPPGASKKTKTITAKTYSSKFFKRPNLPGSAIPEQNAYQQLGVNTSLHSTIDSIQPGQIDDRRIMKRNAYFEKLSQQLKKLQGKNKEGGASVNNPEESDMPGTSDREAYINQYQEKPAQNPGEGNDGTFIYPNAENSVSLDPGEESPEQNQEMNEAPLEHEETGVYPEDDSDRALLPGEMGQ